jgi:hypothetical protein
MVIVWNAKSGVPIRSIFNAHAHGVAAIDMTGDAMFIATLSDPPNPGDPQVGLPRGKKITARLCTAPGAP